ncbi:hydroxyisourate hydrolase [Rhizohabitans arisaemae]|uniref:hydroxyisourate hydrolase n=1 Tax=Rhizohabitans arisaemae TaxID=2720610 RepID=UPI0024B07773|nr:hydroxyisourate hydrolase [Rhizohabitans arisaemae]
MGISVQALDAVYGRPAAGVRTRIERSINGRWSACSDAETDQRGHVGEWSGQKFERGLYRIVFESDRYFVSLGYRAAYTEIVVMFRMQDEADSAQIQVQFSPYSYSTYLGSFG